jgi:uroporphyrinogen III methyltransferase/synthase
MGDTVVLTASAGTFPGLAEALREILVAVEERPLLSFGPPSDWKPLDAALDRLSGYGSIAFTSRRAAQAFTARMQARENPPGMGAAEVLARSMVQEVVGGSVLFPCGDLRRDELPDELHKRGMEVDEIVCYRSVLADESQARTAAARGTVLVVASPSVADLLARACPSAARPDLLAVGPTTAASARAAGWLPAAVANEPTVSALSTAILDLLSKH